MYKMLNLNLYVLFFKAQTIFFYFLTLQYCIGFAIYQHESTTGIHVFPILNPPPSLYHPSGSILQILLSFTSPTYCQSLLKSKIIQLCIYLVSTVQHHCLEENPEIRDFRQKELSLSQRNKLELRAFLAACFFYCFVCSSFYP